MDDGKGNRHGRQCVVIHSDDDDDDDYHQQHKVIIIICCESKPQKEKPAVRTE